MKHLSAVGNPRRHVTALLLALSVGVVAAPASAGDFELAVQVGRALPFYSQSFAFDPGDLLPPDLPVQTSGGFGLELNGGLTVSGALTWRFSESLGLEARVDTVKVDLQVSGGQVNGGQVSVAASPIEEALAAALDPIEFESGFFQATGGVVFAF